MTQQTSQTHTKRMGVLLGQNIAAARHKRGWTQQELAEQVGIESVTVSRLETGASLPSIVRLADIAEALDVTLAELVSGVSPHPSGQAKEITSYLGRLSDDDRAFVLEVVRGFAARLAGRK